ncbi:uncharacterized protein LOC134828458 [Culicoides brevitarsis]|uniref:uncharacterized protein LOC134828458 n=1 Tax=Culicoides brevitarsis TaxID=469753 RepID=UPI00307B6E78
MLKIILTLLFGVIFSVSAQNTSNRYVGCFSDNLGNRMFEEVTYMDGTLSVENCANYCKSKKFAYLGLEWARDCRCGNSLKDRASFPQLPESSCSLACPGNSSQKCGSFGIQSVYETGYEDESQKPLIDFVVKKIDLKNFEYVGCFKDIAVSDYRMWEFGVFWDYTNSIYNCVKFCQERLYIFAGVENGRECWCGNGLRDTVKYPKLKDSLCNKPCTGNFDENCGADKKMAIYRTGNRVYLKRKGGTILELNNGKFVPISVL